MTAGRNVCGVAAARSSKSGASRLGSAASGSTALALCLAALSTSEAEARITRIEITRTEPAFEGKTFGKTGAYEKLVGRA